MRPSQIEVVDALKDAIENGHDLLIDKSRDEGATFLILGMFLLYFVAVPQSMFLCGSRVEPLVDKAGNPKTLFWKLDYLLKHLPTSLLPNVDRMHLHLANLDNEAAINGDATSENFGAGDRRLAVMLDEFGRVEHKIAQNIRETLSDTSDCVIYNSTHFYGMGHPYCKLLQSGKIQVVVLPWEKNPAKNEGLYRSPDLNVIEIKDIGYYRKRYPNCFNEIEPMQGFKYNELESELLTHPAAHDLTFVADGGESNEGGWRSPWYDIEDKRRDRRDIAQNVDRNPIGSTDMFFDPAVCRRIKLDKVRPPDYKGEVEYTLDKNGKIKGVKFVPDGGKQRFLWWGKLVKDKSQQDRLRPVQSHNYIVACDISGGTGQSNSVAGVYDVNTREKVGIFVCSRTPPESFADQAIAICKWAGGATKRAYLIWESNGPGGSFDKRVYWHGYNFVYTITEERIPYRPRGKKRGWFNNRQTKYDLLLELRIALAEGLQTKPKHKALIIHDEKTVEEYVKYSFYENGDIGSSECIDEESGAKAAHGDRVIADGLYVLALSEQPKAALKEQAKMTPGSFAWRRQEYISNRKKKKDMWKD